MVDLKRGLPTEQVKSLQLKYGKNELQVEEKEGMLKKVFHTITEPMFLLLIIAAVIYFILGEPRDGAIMLIFVVGIICIEVIQEVKTDKTLSALKDLSAPQVKVIRDGEEQIILSADLVPGDLMIISEGVKIPADGTVVSVSSLCVDESSLTGESEKVWKVTSDLANDSSDYWKKDYCYAGTLVLQGSAIVLVDKIGVSTEYGKIGKNVAQAPEGKTPLQKQTDGLVKLCAIIAAILFVTVGVITFFNIADHGLKARIIESILSGVTLAMAMIPEEFPVILTVFLSMGAWRLAKKNSLVHRLPSVETLGAVSVLCVDKTGTITMNQMEVEEMWASDSDSQKLAEIMGMGCQTDAYDPMEKAMLDYCKDMDITREYLFSGRHIKEYAFSNELKIMGRVWQRDDKILVAAKGSQESLLKLCDISEEESKKVESKAIEMYEKGLRVIAVACQELSETQEAPKEITDCKLTFVGLVGLADPPRDGVKENIKICTKAGVRVVMITGDNGITAKAIAAKVGIPNCEQVITGDELENMTDEELSERVKTVNIFSRVIPEHKMRIVRAFKESGNIVAMTGDGVNDAPALKYSDIGIAMGKHGSEVSREASDLILMDDNFSTIVDTIKDGRRIYDNIRKAIEYVFTIHIPIALTSLMAPLLNVNPSDLLLLPLHVVLLELVIDPTCSIVLERQQAEDNIMERKPRNPKGSILSMKSVIKSVIQGMIVFIAAFITYLFILKQGTQNVELARTMGLSIIMLANIFIVQTNSSDTEYIFKSMKKLSKDKILWTINVLTVVGLLVIIYSPINKLLKLTALSFTQLIIVVGIAFVSTMWYEVVKVFKKVKNK